MVRLAKKKGMSKMCCCKDSFWETPSRSFCVLASPEIAISFRHLRIFSSVFSVFIDKYTHQRICSTSLIKHICSWPNKFIINLTPFSPMLVSEFAVLGQLPPTLNSNTNPNPNPNRGAVFIEDNCPDNKFRTLKC